MLTIVALSAVAIIIGALSFATESKEDRDEQNRKIRDELKRKIASD
jgi:hypothetical protein